MENIYGELEASVQAKIEADNDFQSELNTLDGNERDTRLEEKKSELLNQELADLKKAKELADNYKVRAEKAEKQLKIPAKKDDKQGNMSFQDMRALNKVDDDDLKTVINYAKINEISIPEATKAPELIIILKARAEVRKTALATNTGGGRRGTAQLSDERVLQDFEQGKVSENDDDITRLAEARFNQRKNRK